MSSSQQIVRRETPQRGFSLVEVLVALFVLAVGLLGLAMLQTTGIKFTTNSYSRTQATYLAYDIIERMRANTTGFNAGSYDIEDISDAKAVIDTYNSCKTTSCACSSTACSPDNLAIHDLGLWYEQQDNLIPGARDIAGLTSGPQRATIERDPANPNYVTITIYWLEQDPGATEPAQKSQIWEVEIHPTT